MCQDRATAQGRRPRGQMLGVRSTACVGLGTPSTSRGDADSLCRDWAFERFCTFGPSALRALDPSARRTWRETAARRGDSRTLAGDGCTTLVWVRGRRPRSARRVGASRAARPRPESVAYRWPDRPHPTGDGLCPSSQPGETHHTLCHAATSGARVIGAARSMGTEQLPPRFASDRVRLDVRVPQLAVTYLDSLSASLRVMARAQQADDPARGHAATARRTNAYRTRTVPLLEHHCAAGVRRSLKPRVVRCGSRGRPGEGLSRYAFEGR